MTAAAISIVYVFVGSLAAGWILVGLICRMLLRRGLLDIPNARSSHATPTPRGGGIAIVSVTMAAVAVDLALHQIPTVLAVAWLLGGAMVATVGFEDDVRGLSAIVRAGVHFAAAILLLFAIDVPVLLASIGLGLEWLWPFRIVMALVIVWSINLFNFMDGIDALASAQCVFVLSAATLLTAMAHQLDPSLWPAIAMAGASAGFLIWNVPPARIFMGDVGSGFIGFGLIASALSSTSFGVVGPLSWLVLNGLFVADSTVTLLVRLFAGELIFQAHRSHVYQRLARRWCSHGRVTLAYMGVNLVWCLPWAIATSRFPSHAAVLTVSALLPLCVIAIVMGGGQTESGRGA